MTKYELTESEKLYLKDVFNVGRYYTTYMHKSLVDKKYCEINESTNTVALTTLGYAAFATHCLTTRAKRILKRLGKSYGFKHLNAIVTKDQLHAVNELVEHGLIKTRFTKHGPKIATTLKYENVCYYLRCSEVIKQINSNNNDVIGQ